MEEFRHSSDLQIAAHENDNHQHADMNGATATVSGTAPLKMASTTATSELVPSSNGAVPATNGDAPTTNKFNLTTDGAAPETKIAVASNGAHEFSFSNGARHEGDRTALPSKETILMTMPNLENSRRKLFILTASDQDCVKDQSQDLSHYLLTKRDDDGHLLSDLAFTLAERRSMLDWKLAVSASSIHDLQGSLERQDVHVNRALKTPGVGFIFTGQGAQWPTMGQELMIYPTFASTLRQADACIRSMGAAWSLIGEIMRYAILKIKY